jgi:hypothetical protein
VPAPPLDERGIRLDDAKPTFSVAHLAASVARLGLNITCIDCSGPGMNELTERLKAPDAVDDVTRAGNDILGYVAGLLGGEFLQVSIDRLLNDAKRKCPHHPDYEIDPSDMQYTGFEPQAPSSSMSLLVVLIIVGVCLTVATVVIVLLTKYIVRRRSARWVKSLPEDAVLRLWWQQRIAKKKEIALNSSTKSMFTSPDIPLWVRWSMPFVVSAERLLES